MISRNVLYAIVGALVMAVAVLGYNLYQERRARRIVDQRWSEWLEDRRAIAVRAACALSIRALICTLTTVPSSSVSTIRRSKRSLQRVGERDDQAVAHQEADHRVGI